MSQTQDRPDRGPTYRTPRWVKIFGIIVLVLVLLAVAVLVLGIGGDHGPGRHMPSLDAGGHPSPRVNDEASLASHKLPCSVTANGAPYQ